MFLLSLVVVFIIIFTLCFLTLFKKSKTYNKNKVILPTNQYNKNDDVSDYYSCNDVYFVILINKIKN